MSSSNESEIITWRSMFKKLKDKIAEEVKQTPLKFHTSVQQFTQSVSPSLTPNTSLSETNSAFDNEEEVEETRDLSESSLPEYDNSFTTVDLRSPVTSKVRRSSSSSIASDLFPIYEFPTNRPSLQSDLESCSEFDDGSSIHQFNNVTKENLYEKYRTALQKYHKYRGRFSDVQKYCQELQRELNKAKNVLTETQDKAIRRIAELKEQCSLEQKAKAHLEDALRNELEERDHIINTLNTKIELLKSGKNPEDDQILVTNNDSEKKSANKNALHSSTEVDSLKEKIKKFESLLTNAKDVILNKTAQIKELQIKAECNEEKLKSANNRIKNLEDIIDLAKRKEEEALLSLAENKLHVHQELEAKESHIKTLEKKIAELNEELKKSRVVKSCNEKSIENDESQSGSKDKNYETLKRELQQLLASKVLDQNTIAEKDCLIQQFQLAIDSSNQELSKLRNKVECSSFFSKSGNSRIVDLKTLLKQTQATAENLESSLADKQHEFECTIRQLTDTKIQLESKVAQLEQELSIVKTQTLEKGTLCKSLEDKITFLTNQLENCKTTINEKDEKLNELQRLESELVSANVKIKDYVNEKKSWTEGETHLKADKIVLEETIKSVRKELNTARLELQEAKNLATERAKDAGEMKKMEKRLADSENELSQLKMEVERDKENEHEMLVRTANLLEEINSLKTKEDVHLGEIRKLKAEIGVLQNQVKEVTSLKTKSDALNTNLETRLQDQKKLETELSITRAELNTFEDKIKLAIMSKENAIKINEELKSKITQLSKEFDEQKLINRELNDVKMRFNEMQKDLERVNNINKGLEKENKTLKVECQQISDELSKIRLTSDANYKLRIEHEELKIQFQRVEDKNSELEKENEVLLKKINFLSTKNSDFQTVHCELQTQYRVEAKISELEKEKNDLLQQIDSLKIVAEEKNKDESLLLSTSDVSETPKREYDEKPDYAKLYLETYDYVKLFLKDLQPVLKTCIKFKKYLADTQKLKEDLLCENEAASKTISQLEAQLAQFSEERMEDPLHKNLLYDLRKHSLSLKHEYVRMKNEVSSDLNVLKQCCKECDIKMNNGPIKMIRDHLRHVFNLECRLSTIEPECERLKIENHQLLEKIEELSSNTSQLQEIKNEYSNKIEIIVTDYETKLMLKEKEYEELQNSKIARDKAQIAAMSNETKEILQTMEEELAMKQEAFEKLLEEQRHDMEKFNNEKMEMKEQHVRELRESDKRWRNCLDKKIQEVEEKYKEEINELTKEWSNDRKQAIPISDIDFKSEEEVLENYASRNEDAETLKKQVELLSNELNNYKRSHWKNVELDNCRGTDDSELSLEDCTELEYLRNILFEYMMGHQPLVLAKVLAAVVKFDNDQTQQVLQREEQKLSLLGHLKLT